MDPSHLCVDLDFGRIHSCRSRLSRYHEILHRLNQRINFDNRHSNGANPRLFRSTSFGRCPGMTLVSWAHQFSVQVDWLTNDLFACTHADHPVVLWSTTPRLRIVKRLSEVANLVNVCSRDQYMTLQSSANRIKFYEKDDCHNEIKLKSDFIAGSVSALEYLRLNRMFLVGSSQGMIRLACWLIPFMLPLCLLQEVHLFIFCDVFNE